MKKGGIILGTLCLAAAGAAGAVKYSRVKKSEESMREQESRTRRYQLILADWLAMKQRGESIIDFFKEKQYNKIVIYGMGTLGWRLYDDIKDSDVQIAYAIDRNANIMGNPIEMRVPETLEDGVDEDVDVVVITPIADFNSIVEDYHFNVPVVSLEDVIYKRI